MTTLLAGLEGASHDWLGGKEVRDPLPSTACLVVWEGAASCVIGRIVRIVQCESTRCYETQRLRAGLRDSQLLRNSELRDCKTVSYFETPRL